jgi:hypothetical protein
MSAARAALTLAEAVGLALAAAIVAATAIAALVLLSLVAGGPT